MGGLPIIGDFPLQNHSFIHPHLFLLFLPSSGWLMAVLLLPKFPYTVGKSKCSRVLLNVFLRLDKNPRHLASRTVFFGTPGQISLKPIKPRLRRNSGRMGSLNISWFYQSYNHATFLLRRWRYRSVFMPQRLRPRQFPEVWATLLDNKGILPA